MRWLAVGAWTVLIFVTVPVAEVIQQSVARTFGRDAFLAAVILATMAAVIASLLRLRGTARLTPARSVFLIAIAAVLMAASLSLRRNPEEAVHFLEYGVLGALLYQALLPRCPNPLVYPSVLMLTAAVALVDEALQWVMPGRYWELRDVGLNLSAAALVLMAMAVAIDPATARGGLDVRSVRTFIRATVLALSLLALSMLNTPARIAWYTERWPALAFLANSDSAMFEYGYYYDDPVTGSFKSRLAPADLELADKRRGADVAAILDRHGEPREYSDLLRMYSPVTDPFVHEVRVHLFRRDRYTERAAGYPEGSPDRARCATIAYSEHLILERYFGDTVSHSTFRLDDAQLRWLQAQLLPMAEQAGAIADSESAVSRGLVTSVTEGQAMALFVLLVFALCVADRRLARMSATR